jgi:hypothetical protein
MNTIEKTKTAFRKVHALVWFAAGLLLFAGLLLLFLGSKSGPTVAGFVRLDNDELLTEGTIRFVPIEGTDGPDSGADIKNGYYRIEKGLRVGKYRVEIQATKELRRPVINPVIPSEMFQAEVPAIAPEYNVKSGLIVEVLPGANKDVDFDVKGTGKHSQ